jgi:hypothetical protein
MQTLLYRAFPWIATAASTAAILAITSGLVSAHDAPTGWTYPLSCCSDYDCRQVPADWVEERPDGYRIVITGETIPMTSRKVKHSPDGVYHWCSVAGSDEGSTICLFVPPRSF